MKMVEKQLKVARGPDDCFMFMGDRETLFMVWGALFGVGTDDGLNSQLLATGRSDYVLVVKTSRDEEYEVGNALEEHFGENPIKGL